MVQYDPFAPLLDNTALPTREKSPSHAHDQAEMPHGAVHPQLRRLSSSHSPTRHYCARCHMRRSSQELLHTRSHEHSPDEESWDGFCPDIAMPTDMAPRPAHHHARRHSGLCPDDMILSKHADGTSSPTQITVKARSCRHNKSGYHHDCHCSSVTPVENLSERYGLVEEPQEISRKTQSLDKQAAEKVAEIMHDELLADMEAQSRVLIAIHDQMGKLMTETNVWDQGKLLEALWIMTGTGASYQCMPGGPLATLAGLDTWTAAIAGRSEEPLCPSNEE